MTGAQEGVIKFQLDYRSAPAPPAGDIASLNSWRRILFLLRLIGQDAQRYDGLGYGNLSQRLLPPGSDQAAAFVISGTQTGGLATLQPEHYTRVLECDPIANRVVARGPVRPSSECLTHGVLYALDERVQCVMHVHSPEIWGQASRLAIPVTDPDVAYGTPAMAGEVQRIYPHAAQHGVFSMGGHQDGIVAFGDSTHLAGRRLVELLARAFTPDTPA